MQAAEAAAQADRELAQRAADEESKKAAREQQKRLRAAFGKACRSAGLDELHTDYLRAALTTEQLQPMLDAFATDARSPQAKAIFASHLSVLLAVEAAAAEVKAQAQAAAAAAAQAKKDAAASLVWSEAEHAALAKGMAKYTHGVALRWHKVRSATQHATRRHAPGLCSDFRLLMLCCLFVAFPSSSSCRCCRLSSLRSPIW